MEPGLEVAGYSFPVDMDDEVAVVRHAQGRLGLLVGQQAHPA